MPSYVRFVRNHFSLTSKSSCTWSTTSFWRDIFTQIKGSKFYSAKPVSEMLTLAALLDTFSVKTMENSWGKRSQFTNSWEAGKLMAVWGLEKCKPLRPPACFMCTPGTGLEVSLSRTKESRSKGGKSKENKDVVRPNICPCMIGNGHEITRSTMAAHWGSRDWKQP